MAATRSAKQRKAPAKASAKRSVPRATESRAQPKRATSKAAPKAKKAPPKAIAAQTKVPVALRERDQLAHRVIELEAKVAELDNLLTRSDRTVRALRDVGLALGSTLDLDQLLELILRKIADLLEAERATLYLLDEHRQRLLSRIILGQEAKNIELPVGLGVAGHVAKYGQTLRIKDAYRDRRFSRQWDDITGYRTKSVLAAPMKNHVGRTIGVIQVLNKRAGAVDEFSQHDEELLGALATQAAVSIDNSRLFLSVIQKNMQLVETKEQLEHRVQDLKLLFDLESSMARASTFEDLACAVVREAARACGSQAGAVMVDEGEAGVFLYFVDVRRSKTSEVRRVGVRRGEGIIGLAMRTNEAQHVARVGQDAPPVSSFLGGVLGIDVKSAVAMPLEGPDDEAIGAIALYNAIKPEGFSQDARALLRLICANASTAVRLFLERIDRERSQRLTSIGRLFSGVMHDIRTPLAVIGGYVQLMAKTEDPHVRAEQAAVIAKQFDHISAMQREVLEFARGERNVLLRKVFLEKFFGDFEEQTRRELENSPIEFRLELLDRGTARLDEVKLQRLLGNLVRNAVEAMADNGGELVVRVERDGDDLVIVVKDTGRGLPKDVRARLYTPFVTSGKQGGTGLGLSIVKKIVEEHHGQIDVQTSASGTTFTVRLPQTETERLLTRSEPSETRSPELVAPSRSKRTRRASRAAAATEEAATEET